MNESNSTALHHTPLHALHLEHGGKMVAFAGYAMPVQYAAGIIKEHLHVRAAAGLFDVSHMGQIEVRAGDGHGDGDGEAIAAALEKLMPADLLNLPVGAQRYALLLNDNGGIVDDLMAQNLGDRFMLVVNAARKVQDFALLRAALTVMPGDFQVELLPRALLALQGPAAVEVLAGLIDGDGGGDGDGLDDFKFMRVREFTAAGVDCIVSRSGYTGEDGFELSVAADDAAVLAGRLLADDRVQLAGLGARDSLRLEAGLCLHGADISAAATPVEAGLNWAVAKVRRPGGARAGGYPGAQVINAQLPANTDRVRVGLLPEGRAPVRAGAALFAAATDAEVGVVTSGAFSPSLRRPVAMGYVAREFAGVDAGPMYTVVRAKRIDIAPAKLPFVAHRYHR